MRLMTNLTDAIGHYLVCWLVSIGLDSIPEGAVVRWRVRVNLHFILFFFFIDQIMCLSLYLMKGKKMKWRTLLSHVIYGTFNTKTYFLIVLGCMHHVGHDLD